MDTVNSLLDANASIIAKAETMTTSSTIISQVIESFSLKLGYLVNKSDKAISISRKNCALTIAYINKSDTDIVCEESSELILHVYTNFTRESAGRNLVASIGIPKETFSQNAEIVYISSYRQSYLFMDDKNLKANLNNTTASKIVKSLVFSATLGHKPVLNLKKNNRIKLRFKKLLSVNTAGTFTCEFWNYTLGKAYNNTEVVIIICVT